MRFRLTRILLYNFFSVLLIVFIQYVELQLIDDWFTRSLTEKLRTLNRRTSSKLRQVNNLLN